MRSILSNLQEGRWTLGRCAFAFALATGPLLGWSQTPAAPPSRNAASASTVQEPLTLSQAYREALAHDAVIGAARASAEARRERLPQAKSQLLPNVSANLSRYKNDLTTSVPGLDGRRVTFDQSYFSSSRSLVVRQPIFRPIQMANYRQAQAEVDDANAILDKETQNVAVRVTGAYLEALQAQDQLALVLAQKQAYITQLEASRRRLSAGSGVRTDIDEAQARLDMALAQELQARQNLEYTRHQLEVLVHQPVTTLAPVDPRRLSLDTLQPALLHDWTVRAEANGPEVRSLSAQREVALHQVDSARSAHLPTLDAVAEWSVSDSSEVTRVNSRFDNKAIGLQLTVPIFAGGLVDSQTRQAIAELQRVEQALEATRLDLGLRVEKEFRAVTEGPLRIRALEQALRSADTMLKSSRRSFEGGSRTMVDVLNAEEQRARAIADLANARYDYMISRIRLRALAGEADERAVAELDGWLRLPTSN